MKNSNIQTLRIDMSINDTINRFINRYLNITKSCRILAYVLRFIKKLRRKNGAKMASFIKPAEIENALKIIVKIIQSKSFLNEGALSTEE